VDKQKPRDQRVAGPAGGVLRKAMIERIKALVLGAEDGGKEAALGAGPDDVQVAAVALLVESAVMDGGFDDAERATIGALIEQRFGLAGADVEALIEAGSAAVEKSHQLFAFTRVLKQGFDFEERRNMIEMLWEVAYADGELHDFEANLVRRVSGLLHVSDRDSGAARKRVLARLGT